eukprot:53542-Chlamydomonas_euryale.AAC.1
MPHLRRTSPPWSDVVLVTPPWSDVVLVPDDSLARFSGRASVAYNSFGLGSEAEAPDPPPFFGVADYFYPGQPMSGWTLALSTSGTTTQYKNDLFTVEAPSLFRDVPGAVTSGPAPGGGTQLTWSGTTGDGAAALQLVVTMSDGNADSVLHTMTVTNLGADAVDDVRFVFRGDPDADDDEAFTLNSVINAPGLTQVQRKGENGD